MKIHRRVLPCLLVTASLLFLAACGTSPGAGPSALYVKPDTGLDTNPGTASAPFKTIEKALTLVRSGESIVLYAGTYDEISGETWNYTVPAGVTLHGNTSGVILQSNTSAGGLTLSGDATIEGVTLKGFGGALMADAGALTLKNTTFDSDNNGIVLTASASATLTSTSFTGSGSGASLYNAATLSMSGGTVTGLDGDVFYITGTASIELTGVQVQDTTSYVLDMRQTSVATLTNCTITNSSPQGSGGSSSLDLVDSATLQLQDTGVDQAYGYAVLARDATTTVDIHGGTFALNGYGGISAAGYLAVDGANVSNNTGDGVDAAGSVVVTNSTLSYNTSYAVNVGSGGSIALFGSQLSGNGGGVILNGSGGNANLGTASKPGNNTIQNLSSGTGLAVFWTSGTIQAVGNTWNPSVQGADASGHYTSQLLSGPMSGENFTMPSGVDVQL